MSLAAGRVPPAEAERFLDVVGSLPVEGAGEPVDLSIQAVVPPDRGRDEGLFP